MTTPCSDAQSAQNKLADDYDAIARRDAFGWIGVGVGAAAVVTGAVLLLTGDDPHRYDRAVIPRVGVAPGRGGLAWSF